MCDLSFFQRFFFFFYKTQALLIFPEAGGCGRVGAEGVQGCVCVGGSPACVSSRPAVSSDWWGNGTWGLQQRRKTGPSQDTGVDTTLRKPPPSPHPLPSHPPPSQWCHQSREINGWRKTSEGKPAIFLKRAARKFLIISTRRPITSAVLLLLLLLLASLSAGSRGAHLCRPPRQPN